MRGCSCVACGSPGVRVRVRVRVGSGLWVLAHVAGRDYDPRRRPWYLSGSNGPKNVIFILDSSGSMQTSSRMSMLKTAAKKLVDSMTFADYIGIIDFDETAKTYLVPPPPRVLARAPTLLASAPYLTLLPVPPYLPPLPHSLACRFASAPHHFFCGRTSHLWRPRRQRFEPR